MALRQYFDSTLTAAKGGAPWAWAALYDDLAGPLATYLEGHASPRINDVVLDTFLEATERVHLFEGPEAGFRAWLFSIAYRRMRALLVERGIVLPNTDISRMSQLADATWLIGSAAPMPSHARTEVGFILRGLAFGSPADSKGRSEAARLRAAAHRLADASGIALVAGALGAAPRNLR